MKNTRAFGVGSNQKGAIGQGEENKKDFLNISEIKENIEGQIMKISVGSNHSLILAKKIENIDEKIVKTNLYVIGNNDYN